MKKTNWIKVSITGCFIFAIITTILSAETEEITGEVKFTEDFGTAAAWYRWNSPEGWYCKKSSTPGIYGALSSIEKTPEGMSGAYLMCGYRKSYFYPCIMRLLPDNMVLSGDGIVTFELSVHLCGEKSSPSSTFGLVANAKVKTVKGKNYLNCDKKNFFGVKVEWHSPRKGVSVNRLVLLTKAGHYGEQYVDNKHYLHSGVTYRFRYRMDIVKDRICLDMKTYKDGKWNSYKQVFAWKPAGLDLSEQNINAMILSPAGNTNNFTTFDELSFSFIMAKQKEK